jgi:hypothetical protein
LLKDKDKKGKKKDKVKKDKKKDKKDKKKDKDEDEEEDDEDEVFLKFFNQIMFSCCNILYFVMIYMLRRRQHNLF